MPMSPQMSFDEKLRQVLGDFNDELQFLTAQQVLTQVDAQKIRNQAEVSGKAMQAAERESSFSDQARIKLRYALLQDFEKSIQKYLDEAISRKGDKALLIHRLYSEDKKIARRADELNTPSEELKKLQIGVKLLKSYIIRSIPDKSSWGSPKMDVSQIAKNYEQTVLEYIQHYQDQPNLLG
jgi:hypothetical protein